MNMAKYFDNGILYVSIGRYEVPDYSFNKGIMVRRCVLNSATDSTKQSYKVTLDVKCRITTETPNDWV